MKKTNYAALVAKQNLSASSGAAKALKENSDDKTLAVAVVKTKAYKENAELKAATDAIIAEGAEKPMAKKEEVKQTSRSGEPRYR